MTFKLKILEGQAIEKINEFCSLGNLIKILNQSVMNNEDQIDSSLVGIIRGIL